MAGYVPSSSFLHSHEMQEYILAALLWNSWELLAGTERVFYHMHACWYVYFPNLSDIWGNIRKNRMTKFESPVWVTDISTPLIIKQGEPSRGCKSDPAQHCETSENGPFIQISSLFLFLELSCSCQWCMQVFATYVSEEPIWMADRFGLIYSKSNISLNRKCEKDF